MVDKKFDLEDRLVVFSAKTATFCNSIPKDVAGNYYGNQLIRPSGSSALNFGEAQGTNTTKGYINKAGISLKERKESRVNLKVLRELGLWRAFFARQSSK